MPFVNGKPSHQTGFKHTAAAKEKIRNAKLGKKRPEITGSLNPNWKGENVSPDGGRLRAWNMYPCPEGKERHHIDGNPKNNEPSNIAFLTPAEHKAIHTSDPKWLRHIKEIGHANKGRKASPETKLKMSLAQKRRFSKKPLVMIKLKNEPQGDYIDDLQALPKEDAC